jgi:hypothetical protein
MSSNLLDDFLIAVRKSIHDVTPLTLTLTIFTLLLPFISAYLLALSQRETKLPPPAGCRRLGLQGRSNLHDQFSKKYSSGAEPSSSNPWSVKALFIYPIKSCAQLELDKSEIIRTGLRYDRQFTFAQYSTGLPTLEGKVDSDWSFITQRTFPRLAKVESEIWFPDPSAPDYDPEGEWVKSEGCVVVRFPFSPDTEFSAQGLKNIGKILAAKLGGRSEPMVEFRLPFNPSKERINKTGYRKEEVKVWGDKPVALNMGCEVPVEIMAKLRYTLGVANPLTLFRIDSENYREVLGCAPKKQDVGFQTVIGMQDSVRDYSPSLHIATRVKSLRYLCDHVLKTSNKWTAQLHSVLHPHYACSNNSTVPNPHHESRLRPRRSLPSPHPLLHFASLSPAIPPQHPPYRPTCLLRRLLDPRPHRRSQLPHFLPHYSLQITECRSCDWHSRSK